ncbi:MAG: fibronectin type III domain-containing protein, partial [Chloroflexi bacterium]|nr:fibronectin type III domain-containing protein [Chloroflexota bacterium]
MTGNSLALLLSVDNLRPNAGGDANFDLLADNQQEGQAGGDVLNFIADATVQVELSKGLEFKSGWTPPDTFVKSDSRSAIWSPPDTDTDFYTTTPYSQEIEIQTQLTSDTLETIPLEARCITARVVDSIPPPSPDYAFGRLKQCLGDDPKLFFEQGTLQAFTAYPCVDADGTAINSYPCDATGSTSQIAVIAVADSDDQNPDPRLQGVGRSSGGEVVLLPEQGITVQVKDPSARVVSGSTVTWQTGRKKGSWSGSKAVPGVIITYSLKDFVDDTMGKECPRPGTIETCRWSNLSDEVKVKGLTQGQHPPGGVKVKVNSKSDTKQFDANSGNSYTSTRPTWDLGRYVSNYVGNFYLEFSTLGTHVVDFTAGVTRRSDSVVQEHIGTYTFHVGPVAELEVRDGGAGSLQPGRRAFSIMAVNNGPDTAPAARVTVTDLPENATVNYTASRGSFEFDDDAGAWVWDIGELLSRDIKQARTGRDGETLTIDTGAAGPFTAAIENTQDYSVCIASNARDVELSSPSETACTTEDATNSWHTAKYYDYDDDNDEAVIKRVAGAGEAQLSAAQVRRDQTVVSVSWPEISTLNQRPVTHYEVARSMDGGKNWKLLSDRWPITTYFDAEASAGPSVRYRVRTVNDRGHKGTWSAGIGSGQSANTPAQPQSVTAATSDAGAIELSWESPTSDGGSPITGYQVQASATGEGGWRNVCRITDATELICEHTGLNVGTTRHYRVAARNANGLGPWSDPPAVGSTELGVPDAPRSLRVQAIQADSGNAVRLTWTEPTRDNGSQIEGYEVEGSLDGSDWTWLGNTNRKSATDLLDDGSVLWFEPGQTRYYRVRAFNDVGKGQWSNTVHAATATAVPEGMSAWAQANGQNAIDIFWWEPSLKGAATISSYEVQVCVPPKECASNNDSDYSRVASPSGTTLSYTHTGLQPGDERYYRVRARNSAGWSEWSWPTSATTLD